MAGQRRVFSAKDHQYGETAIPAESMISRPCSNRLEPKLHPFRTYYAAVFGLPPAHFYLAGSAGHSRHPQFRSVLTCKKILASSSRRS